ncbi:TPM domain-containing protein [Myceligenerans pegani]|uniref:TPM domain-containing protein n=1 Tax=Myceligenerans pegani TaxID=2776917 RepID=A0ABR9MWB5_9MICO|nr:TPM domain-containing protein [Myceligenerans sp. TRM 65318]MBE1875214.1 TPM domain-containing protein [Myceligenerans sp. TRM 65318]MBE3017485.1 TPM domain-containing protein [Myceligenerans sp. TRM 65318]
MTQTPAPPVHPVPDVPPDPEAHAGTASSRHTVLAGVIAGGVLIGLFSAAFAIGGTTPTDQAEADVGGTQPLASEPTPTGTELLSAKVQAATMQDILPSAMPIVVDTPVTDEAGVLSAEEYELVSEAVAAVEAETSLRLFVVYLETFDGIPPEDWADATATKSGLTPEELLLAIATTDRVQGLSVDVNGPVSSREHASIIVASEDAVADGDWAGAAADAADAALATRESGASPWLTVLALLALVAVGAALAVGWWYLRHRQPRGQPGAAGAAEIASAGGDGSGAGDVPAEETARVGATVGATVTSAVAGGEPAGSKTPAAPAWPASGPAVAAPALAPTRSAVPTPVTPARAGVVASVATPGVVGTPSDVEDGELSGAALPGGVAGRDVPGRDVPGRDVPGREVSSDAALDREVPGRDVSDGGPRDDELSDDELSDDDLAARVDDVLVTLDDALRTSAQEFELARAESSGAIVHDLQVVLADATERTQEAFALRAELLAAADGSWRDLALRVLATCAEAATLLDSGTAPLEEVRRLKARANRLLNESWQRAGGLDRQIEQVRKDLADLAEEFPADAVRPVADNAELAERLVEDARRAIDTGRAASAKRDRAFAAATARGAQNALGQAERLLREVEDTRTDLTEATPRLDKAVASLTQDVADTERIAGGDPQAAMARTTARAALKQVEVTRESADPFALLARIAAAEGALDRALVRHRDASEVDARAAALVRDTLERLDVRLRQVDTLITTRRGAVGPDARMRHAEAARLTAAARDARARADRGAALELAHRADTQAYQALTAAMRDAADDGAPSGMPLAGINLTLEGRRGHGAGASNRGGLLGLLIRSPKHVRTGGIGGGFGGGGFGSGRAV